MSFSPYWGQCRVDSFRAQDTRGRDTKPFRRRIQPFQGLDTGNLGLPLSYFSLLVKSLKLLTQLSLLVGWLDLAWTFKTSRNQ